LWGSITTSHHGFWCPYFGIHKRQFRFAKGASLVVRRQKFTSSRKNQIVYWHSRIWPQIMLGLRLTNQISNDWRGIATPIPNFHMDIPRWWCNYFGIILDWKSKRNLWKDFPFCQWDNHRISLIYLSIMNINILMELQKSIIKTKLLNFKLYNAYKEVTYYWMYSKTEI